MKILLATMSMKMGGAETHIAELASELNRRGHTVVLASAGGVYEERLIKEGIECVHAPLDKKSPAAITKSTFIMDKLIKHGGFDLVHAHARIPAFVCGRIARKYGVRFLTTAHGDFYVTNVLRALSDWGEHCFAVSDDIRDYLRREYDVGFDRITVVPNGVDTGVFCPRPKDGEKLKSIGVEPEQRVIMHVSRLDHPAGNLAVSLIDAMRAFGREYPDAVLVTVGDGNDMELAKKYADSVNGELKREAVKLLGARGDVAELLPCADVFIGPSRTAIEAMACGIPTVVAGWQGYIGIFEKENEEKCVKTNFCGRGIKDISSLDCLYDVRKIFGMSAEERAKLASYGRKFVCENYSVKRMVDIYLGVYERFAKIKREGRYDYTVCGYYGFNNVGDETMLKQIVKKIRADEPSSRICVMSHQPQKTANELCVDAVARMNYAKVKKILENTDAFIFGGGNLLQDRTSTLSLVYYTNMIDLAKSCGCRVNIYANGIGPITKAKNKKRAADALASADEISLRDEPSVELCRTFREFNPKIKEPTFVRDPVENITRACGALKTVGIELENYFVIAPKRLEDAKDEYFEDDAADALSKIITEIKDSKALTPVFIAMHEDEDTAICKYLAQKTGGVFITRRLYGEEVAELMAGAELSICSRLHAMVLSRAVGTPTAAFTDDTKLTAYISDAKYKKALFGGKLSVYSEFEI